MLKWAKGYPALIVHRARRSTLEGSGTRTRTRSLLPHVSNPGATFRARLPDQGTRVPGGASARL